MSAVSEAVEFVTERPTAGLPPAPVMARFSIEALVLPETDEPPTLDVPLWELKSEAKPPWMVMPVPPLSVKPGYVPLATSTVCWPFENAVASAVLIVPHGAVVVHAMPEPPGATYTVSGSTVITTLAEPVAPFASVTVSVAVYVPGVG